MNSQKYVALAISAKPAIHKVNMLVPGVFVGPDGLARTCDPKTTHDTVEQAKAELHRITTQHNEVVHEHLTRLHVRRRLVLEAHEAELKRLEASMEDTLRTLAGVITDFEARLLTPDSINSMPVIDNTEK